MNVRHTDRFQEAKRWRSPVSRIAPVMAGIALVVGTLALLGGSGSAAVLMAGPAGGPRGARGIQVGAASHPRLARGVFGTIEQTNNWSGYQASSLLPGSFHQISASWVVPSVSQAVRGQAEDSATWVGIGGGCVEPIDLVVVSTCAVDQTLIQAGSEQDVSASGQASYGVWYEFLPEPETSLPLSVAPGDVVSVDITEGLPASWSISITVKSPGGGTIGSDTIPVTYPALGLTAEWIEESPLVISTSGSGISSLPLLNGGSPVAFSQARLNGANEALAGTTEVQLVDSSGDVVLSPSAPDSDNDAFNDCEDLSSQSTSGFSCPAPASSSDQS